MNPSRTSLWPLWLVSILLGALGGMLIYLGLAARSESERFHTWQRTEADLLELRILELAIPKRPGYIIIARYRFEFNGRSFEGRGVLGENQAQTVDSLKRQISSWLETEPSDWSQNWGTHSVDYVRKIGVTRVPVIHLPSDPQQSFVGVPSRTPPGYRSPMLWTGGLLMMIGVLSLGLLLHVWWRETGPFFTTESNVPGKTPTESEVIEFVQRLDEAILAVRQAMEQDREFSILKGVLEELEEMKHSPKQALAKPPRPGWNRWLVGELGMENWGPPGRKVLDALHELQSVHGKHHVRRDSIQEKG